MSALVLVSTGLTSCGESASSSIDSLAIVVGHTQNVPAIKEGGKLDSEIAGALKELGRAEVEDNVSLFEVTPGNSKIKTTDLKLASQAVVDAERKEKIKSNAKKISEFILTSVKPTENGADYLSSVIKAAKDLGSKGEIIVYGSGLSDSGALDFSTNYYLDPKFDAKALAKKLLDSKEIQDDDLQGLTIKMVGFGESVAPQDLLTEAQKSKVIEIYKVVFEAMGAKKVKSISEPSDQNKTAIDTPWSVNVALTSEQICTPRAYRFDDNKIAFNPNQATFVDESTATNNVKQLVDMLLNDKNGSRSAEIIGYEAIVGGVKVPTSDLTLARANAVKNLLVSQGVPAGKLNARGGGSGPNDGSLPPDQQNNRFVQINVIDVCKK